MTDLSIEVSAELRQDVADIKAKILHDEARSQALGEAIENGEFNPASYTHSIHRAPSYFIAECGCVARTEERTDDGESVYRDWVWNDSKCLIRLLTNTCARQEVLSLSRDQI